jgi:hypothetical protein
MAHRLNCLMASAVAVVAVSATAGYSAPALAHGYQACCDMVRDFCGSDQSCINSGCNQCMFHSHPGAEVPDPPDVPKTADPGRQPRKGFGFKQR